MAQRNIIILPGLWKKRINSEVQQSSLIIHRKSSSEKEKMTGLVKKVTREGPHINTVDTEYSLSFLIPQGIYTEILRLTK